MPQAQYKAGDRVQYRPIGGASDTTSVSTGQIVKVITTDQPAGETGNVVKATQESPRYLIKNDSTGKETAYNTDNIMGHC